MNYVESRAYLDRLGNEVLTMKFGLETIRTLLAALGNPHRNYPSILITGTNGKGSVARFLSSVLTECGLHTGLYTSPHLVCPEERIVIGGERVDEDYFASLVTRVVETISALERSAGSGARDSGGGSPNPRPTFFETLTACAFLGFSERRVDVAVLEIGMGGRLDSTNVVDPELSIVTKVGLDHQKYLGDTLEAIAREKAGIIHPGRPVLLAPQRPEALAVLLSEASRRSAPVYPLDEGLIEARAGADGRYTLRFGGLTCRLQVHGRHQVENATVAIEAARILRERGWALSDPCIGRGIERARLQGTLQPFGNRPAVYLDGGHNRDAAESLARFLQEHTLPSRHLVFGMMRDKDIPVVLETLRPCFDRIFFTQVDSPRAAAAAELAEIVPEGIAVVPPALALERAREGDPETILVTGSFYLIGKILEGCSEGRSEG